MNRGPVPDSAPSGVPGGTETAAAAEGRGLLALPGLPPPADPFVLVRTDPAPPGQGRPCGNRSCRLPVGRHYPGTVIRYEGYCPECGTPYSLLPQLRAGEPLDGGRYEVRGPLAHGGLGWVYLAVDTRLRHRPIVLKGVLNPHDTEARERMLEERNQLIALSHGSVVRIYDYVPHRPDDGRIAADYIVMEYVGGKSLRTVLEETERGRSPFGPGRPLTLEHVARYGCQILAALAFLHDRGLVYSDMKPDNVIHRGTRVVLIDLGGVQRLDDGRTPVTTERYAAPETGPGRGAPTVAHDLYTVGRTLEELAGAAVDGYAGYAEEAGYAGYAGYAGEGDDVDRGLGHHSFRLLVERATHRDPGRRFASAAEMAEQLEGVLRELLSLRTKRQYTRPSEVFEPTPALLDAGLGGIPGPPHWRDRAARDYRGRLTAPVLHPGCPTPSRVAVGLPVPLPHRGDPAAVQLRLPAPPDPRAAVRQMERLLEAEAETDTATAAEAGAGTGAGAAGEAGPRLPADADTGVDRRSVEVRLRLCRAHLHIREELPVGHRDRVRELARAEGRLRDAEEVLGTDREDRPAPDWRLAWHRGLLRLARGDAETAEGHFEEVYEALPGEYAPKLVLGYCAEWRGDLDRARRLYNAVWRRNTQQGSAAFGLARVHLARGGRRAAAEVLGRVSAVSRHYDAARTAAVRIRAARLPDPGGLPTWRDLAAVRRELPRLVLDGGASTGPERDRLTAELREWALDWVQRTAGDGARTGEQAHREDRAHLADLAGDLYGGRHGQPVTERELRTLLARSLGALARLPGTTRAESEHLVDCANAVLPRTWFVLPGREVTR
ncbi:serine/threonine-protein kinase [Streptomyces carminius]|uniref:serine/threonine-protein kinase n=1 Tax=Streptomyces carminius TaxID=2665496 RepID=UPI0011B43FE0|nr:serine/threonine-protein kinase [Streptomyces carminius]